jgi:hypothetical protein
MPFASRPAGERDLPPDADPERPIERSTLTRIESRED